MASPTVAYSVEKVTSTYHEAVQRFMQERHALERGWFQSVLFFLGIQWISYNPSTRRWGPRTKLKPWVPRPVTNKFAVGANTIIQILRAKPPSVVLVPETDNPDDVATADLGNSVLDQLYQEAGAKEARRVLASWVTLTGNAFIHTFYDNSPTHGTEFVQHQMCSVCKQTFPPDTIEEDGTCPNCGPAQPTLMMPAVDDAGQPLGEDFARGRLRTEIFSPFEIYVDQQARSMADVTELMARRRYSSDEVFARWGKKVEPNSRDQSEGGTGQSLLRSIAYAAGTGGPAVGASGSSDNDTGVVVDFLWKRPCPDYPEGLVAVFSGNDLLNEKEVPNGIPYRDKEGNPRWPWRHVGFDRVPGRFWYKTPLTDVIPKQEQRNRLESLIQLITMRCANPVWLTPKNIGFDMITGEPGEILSYNFMQAGQKPERVEGSNVPTTLIGWLEKIDSDIEELLGTYEVLRGNAPTGVSAGTALRLLLERAVTRFTPVIEQIEEEWGEATRDLFLTLQQFGTDTRIARIAGPGKTWEIQQFSNADLTGAVDVRVEAGSAVPKNTVGTQAAIQDLVEMGVVNPQDPETQYRILEEFQQTKLLGSVDDNIKQAQREEWNFFEQGAVPIVDEIIDNHIVHVMSHKKRALQSDFITLPPAEQAIWKQHIMEHMMFAQAAAAPAPVAAEGEESADGEGSGGAPDADGGSPQPGGPPPQDAQMPPAYPGGI